MKISKIPGQALKSVWNSDFDKNRKKITQFSGAAYYFQINVDKNTLAQQKCKNNRHKIDQKLYFMVGKKKNVVRM